MAQSDKDADKVTVIENMESSLEQILNLERMFQIVPSRAFDDKAKKADFLSSGFSPF
jgi:hypothetical protein